MSGARSVWTGRKEESELLPKPRALTHREMLQAAADAPFCMNPVHRNKTVKDGAGKGWFTRGGEVKPKPVGKVKRKR